MTTTPDPAPAPDDAAPPAVPGTPEPPPTPPETEPGADDGKPGREAARYRTQLRATEAERDSAREQLTAIRRQAAEDASGLLKPSALWAAGVNLDELYTEDGRLDRDRLTEAVSTAAEALGLTRAPRRPKPDPSQGAASDSPRTSRWADVIKR